MNYPNVEIPLLILLYIAFPYFHKSCRYSPADTRLGIIIWYTYVYLLWPLTFLAFGLVVVNFRHDHNIAIHRAKKDGRAFCITCSETHYNYIEGLSEQGKKHTTISGLIHSLWE